MTDTLFTVAPVDNSKRHHHAVARMATVTKKPTGFDLKLFEQMQEPISIRIERKNPRSGQMEPIPLPQPQWAKEDARRIENIILKDVSGGGSYKGQMIGADGKTMDWAFAYPTNFYPELIPPGSADALGVPGVLAGAHPAVAGTPAAVPPWQSGAYGQPIAPPTAPQLPGYTGPQAPPMQSAGFSFPPMPPMPPAPLMNYMQGHNPYGYAPPPAASTQRAPGGSPELDAVKQQLAAARRQADEERHARERESQAASFRADTESRERKHSEEMRQLREMIAENKQPARSDSDPVLLAMRQQNEALQKQMDEQRRINDQQQAEVRRQTEAQQADQRHRDEMRQMQENNQRQIDSMKEMIAKMGENKSDPMMMSLIEMQRGQMDTAREASRQQAESTREQSRLSSEQPRLIVDMMSKMREASGGEQMLSNIGNAYANANQMMMQAMEAMSGMGQSPGMALAEGALASGKEVLERFMIGKRDSDLAKERTAQVHSQSQAAAQQSQAYYAAQVAAQTQDVYRDENGNIISQPPERDQLEGAEAVEGADADGVEVVDGAPIDAQEITGDKEEVIFGPLYDHVKQLRAVVESGDAGPEAVAQVIIEAIFEIDKRGATVPAFSLVLEDRYAELMDLLLPSAPTQFVGEAIQHLQKKLSELGVDFSKKQDGGSEPPAPAEPVQITADPDSQPTNVN